MRVVNNNPFDGNKDKLRCFHTFKKFLLKNGIKNVEHLPGEIINLFIEKRIQKWDELNKLRPYRIENLKIYMYHILEHLGISLTTSLRSQIKNHINKIARPLLEANSYFNKRAPTFDLHTIDRAIRELLKGKHPKDQAAATIMAMAFTTGARIQDLMNVRTERIIAIGNKTGHYLKIVMKTSKSNPIAKNPEQLTFMRHNNNIIKTDEILKSWISTSGNKTGLTFKNFTAKQMINRFRAVSRKLNISPPITGHSGRNSMVAALYESNVDKDSKIIKMRWTADTQMHMHYRQTLMEETVCGATYQLHQGKFNQF